MATATFVPIETYLRMETEPDCEYVDGHIEERPAAEFDHASWHGALLAFFTERRIDWKVRALTSLRTRVSATRIRVPDVAVLSRSAPLEQIIETPPLAVFEILSPENRMAAMMEKFADYERMGIAGIWIIDPRKSVEESIGYGYQSGTLETVSTFSLPSLWITFAMKEIAAFID